MAKTEKRVYNVKVRFDTTGLNHRVPGLLTTELVSGEFYEVDFVEEFYLKVRDFVIRIPSKIPTQDAIAEYGLRLQHEEVFARGFGPSLTTSPLSITDAYTFCTERLKTGDTQIFKTGQLRLEGYHYDFRPFLFNFVYKDVIWRECYALKTEEVRLIARRLHPVSRIERITNPYNPYEDVSRAKRELNLFKNL